MGGIGPPCGNGVLGLAGRIGCSGTHIDSKPNASAPRQKSAGLAVSSVNGISSPIFMLSPLVLAGPLQRPTIDRAVDRNTRPIARILNLSRDRQQRPDEATADWGSRKAPPGRPLFRIGRVG